ncbi:biotin--[acetyl-CoA-carboxylase] ligase [Gorillibacterium massiliense]|uniref:biotin--[acetyl-CoA-carboxylase] ligase n=1 Tax=Gorillibacterium massiliense TaxID=1280390 RepID=UPI0004B93BA1|nr:biotin--[acetyl-CoA-carboxylase] ligase [Gorillibacterium massiliense]
MDKKQLIALFAEHPGVFFSGEKISAELGVSRTAVWKHIQSLKEDGYVFESSSRKGYRLVSQPERLDETLLLAQLQTRELGHPLLVLEETSSTQDAAREWAERGAPHGALVVADAQTAGRGRMGRSWHSPAGKGIYMSLVLRPDIPMQHTPQMTLLAAVALCRTFRREASVDASIKWPNDILINGRKVSGILMESSAEDERLSYIIAGFGISVNLQKEDYPDHLHDVATSLFIESGQPIQREDLIASFLQEYEKWFSVYMAEGFAPILSLWEALSSTLGRVITAYTPKGPQKGTALRLHESGALTIRTENGQEMNVFSGDIREENKTLTEKTM